MGFSAGLPVAMDGARAYWNQDSKAFNRAMRNDRKRARRHFPHVFFLCGLKATRMRKGPGQFSRADRNRHRNMLGNLQKFLKQHTRQPSLGLLLDSGTYAV